MRRLFTMCVALICACSMMAQNKASQAKAGERLDDQIWGYSVSETFSADDRIGFDRLGYYSASIYIPGDQVLQGSRLKGIRFPVVSTDMYDTRVWVRKVNALMNPSGELIVEKPVTDMTLNAYNVALLDEPVDVPAEGFFIGITFAVKKSVYAIITSHGEADEDNGSWMGINAFADETLTSMDDEPTLWGSYPSMGYILMQGVFDNVDVPEAMINMTSLERRTVVAGQENTVAVHLKSDCRNQVDNVTYTIDNGEKTVEYTLPLNPPLPAGLRQAGDYTFTYLAPEKVASSGNAVTFAITKVNGVDNVKADQTQLMQLVTTSRDVQRKTLVEELTGTGCPNCPRGWAAMETLREKYPDQFVGVALHQYNSGDPMYIGDQLYTVLNFPGAPYSTVDRKIMGDPFMHALPAFNIYNSEKPLADIALDAVYNADSTSVDISATVEALTNGLSYEMMFVVTADGLCANDDMSASNKQKWLQMNNLANSTPIPEDSEEYNEYYNAFCYGGDYNQSLVNLTYNDVAIRSSYEGGTNQISALGKLSAGETKTVSYSVPHYNSLKANKNLRLAFNASQANGDVYAVAIVTNKADGTVCQAERVRVQAYGSTGIENVTAGNGSNARPVARYTADGRRVALDSPVKGLNIVKMSDGSVVKVNM